MNLNKMKHARSSSMGSVREGVMHARAGSLGGGPFGNGVAGGIDIDVPMRYEVVAW